MLELNKIRKIINNRIIINDFSFIFEDNGLYFLIGSNGSGKTSVLNSISGSINIDGGNVSYNDCKIFDNDESIIDFRKNHLTYITQKPVLFEDESFEHNLLFFVDASFEDDDVQKCLEKMNLNILDKNEKVKNLSGGERQKLWILMHILACKDIILVDEPTENVDENSRLEIMDYLYELSKTNLVICVTHDLFFLDEYESTIIKMDQGAIKETYSYKPKFNRNTTIKIGDRIEKAKNVYKLLKDEMTKTGGHSTILEIENESECKEKIEFHTLKRKKDPFKRITFNGSILHFINSVIIITTFLAVTLLTLVLFDSKKTIEKYYNKNEIQIVKPYLEYEYIDIYDNESSIQIFNGCVIENELRELNIEYEKCFEGENITYMFNGVESGVSVNVVVTEKMEANVGRNPISYDEFLISDILYKKMFKSDDYKVPFEFEIKNQKMKCVGIYNVMDEYLAFNDKSMKEYYETEFFNTIYCLHMPTFISDFSTIKAEILGIPRKISIVKDDSLKDDEIKISDYLKRKVKQENDKLHFEKTHGTDHFYDDCLDLSDYYSDGAKAVGTSENQFQINVSLEIFSLMKEEYDNHYAYDNLIVKTDSKTISKMIKDSFLFKEENVHTIVSYSRTIDEISYLLLPILIVSSVLFICALIFYSFLMIKSNKKTFAIMKQNGEERKRIFNKFSFSAILKIALDFFISFILYSIFVCIINAVFKRTIININFFYIDIRIVVSIILFGLFVFVPSFYAFLHYFDKKEIADLFRE